MTEDPQSTLLAKAAKHMLELELTSEPQMVQNYSAYCNAKKTYAYCVSTIIEIFYKIYISTNEKKENRSNNKMVITKQLDVSGMYSKLTSLLNWSSLKLWQQTQ